MTAPSRRAGGRGDAAAHSSSSSSSSTATSGNGNGAPLPRSALIGLLALPWALYTYSTVSRLNAGGISPHGRGRARSRSLAVYQSCSLSVLREPDRPVVPVYGASYPGSGSATLHYVAEALTGLEAGEDSKDKADSYDKVLIRTHYPAWKRRVGGDVRLMDRAILLVRNPLDALPAHASLYYERDRGLPVNGETPASAEFWVEWRDKHFDAEMGKWSDHVNHWASREPREKRLVVTYENLVDEKRGMVEAGRIGTFLARGEGVESVPTERVPCVWDKVVNYGKEKERKLREEREREAKRKEEAAEAAAKAKAKGAKGKKGEESAADKIRSLRATTASSEEGPRHEYTAEQLETALGTLGALREKFAADSTLSVALEEYAEDCKWRLKKRAEAEGGREKIKEKEKKRADDTKKKGGSN